MKKFEGLLRSEIAKAEKFATQKNGKDTRMGGYFFDGVVDEWGWAAVTCEMLSNDLEDREDDVKLLVFLPDRRRSFVSKW